MHAEFGHTIVEIDGRPCSEISDALSNMFWRRFRDFSAPKGKEEMDFETYQRMYEEMIPTP